ncbi:heme ABC transporter ATP-binding protein [Bacillus sp. ISL-35]|uniref:heme ABC transporter ATP-binding protein n=1 Tax=Bacillus sp. ISL-35 TaxID=2819122 RepID=UPI001BEB90A6|nr:heme ABC transporter ATP-binding protein [Bacillus sp. ISL-35]MBT2681293.1 heme ABC transporter ATP-binding protein [Bacillus sp. ISL-35]MBT2705501.1 heme ABC transporter ATP-binding protein [Chryseobacterium sp. ISL-80]
MITVKNLTGGYAGGEVLKGISFEVGKGELFGILGPNGSGKTTLLKMISGALQFREGAIELDSKPLTQYSPKQLARMMAVLPQHSDQAFPYSVKETVSLGRYAHQKGWFNSWSDEDEQIVLKVMDQTGITHLQEKSIIELSGGEKQRVYLAQALAQQPRILLLDEPTNHLDLSFQKELLDLLKNWASEEQLTVVSIFHDLNLASLYCDRLLLMDNGEVLIVDTPAEVLKEERIKAVYKTQIKNHPHPEIARPQLLLVPEWDGNQAADFKIDARFLDFGLDRITLQSPVKLRTMSSGITGAGIGWHNSFVHRVVPMEYDCSDHKAEMAEYLQGNGFLPSETVAMMTAVPAETVSRRFFEDGELSLFIMVSAGNTHRESPRNINTWLFINGRISEEAFIQSAMTAAEAKMSALQELEGSTLLNAGQNFGISTDSICIAATQQGEEISYAGTASQLGKLINEGIYACTKEAILNYRAGKTLMKESGQSTSNVKLKR